MFRGSNGGNYPQKTSAEFSRTYVNSLRDYEYRETPASVSKPRATLSARKLSKCNADCHFENAGDYYKSQTNFQHDKSIEKAVRATSAYQKKRSVYLSSPTKKINPKFDATASI